MRWPVVKDENVDRAHASKTGKVLELKHLPVSENIPIIPHETVATLDYSCKPCN